MKTAVLIFNPAAGRAHLLKSRLPAIEARLADAGYAMQVLETLPALPPMPACDLIFACGGDGTVHLVVQVVAHTQIPLGIVPLGTANALARNLKLPLDPLAAIDRLLTSTPTRIPLGQIITASETRFFLLMAGCGPDGALIHAMTSAEKARFGRTAYYAHAARLFFTRRWPAFRACFRDAAGHPQEISASGLMASRVPDLGGLFTGLTRQANLTNPTLHLQLLRPPAQLSLPAWFALTGRGLPNPWLTAVDVEEIECLPIDARPVYQQADGEPLGSLPFKLRLVPDALTLLMPS